MHLSRAAKLRFLITVLSVFIFSLPALAAATGNTPQGVRELVQINKFGQTGPGAVTLDDEASLNLRRDAIREAALSFGARGGLARRSFEIMQDLAGHEEVLEQVFDFNQLLLQAPSGLLIEPPIIGESQDALVVEQDGIEAAVADRIYNISDAAKIVTAPRNWRNYLEMHWEEVAPPPRILWPKNAEEQQIWSALVQQGWEEGYTQADEIFQINLDRLVADFNGMVRYRMLLTQGMVSSPYALQEDRGVTGDGLEMRVGDRAVRITGPSLLQTGADQWTPADR